MGPGTVRWLLERRARPVCRHRSVSVQLPAWQVWPLLLSVALLAAGRGLASARVWTDATGRFKVTAELVRVDRDRVVLKRADAQILDFLVTVS